MPTQQQQQATSKSQTSASFDPSFKDNYTILEQELYKNSPIKIIKLEFEKDQPEYYAVLGNKVLTEPFTLKYELEKHMETIGFFHVLMTATAENLYEYLHTKEPLIGGPNNNSL